MTMTGGSRDPAGDSTMVVGAHAHPCRLRSGGRERRPWAHSEAGRLGELPIPGAIAGRGPQGRGSLLAAVDLGPFLGLGTAAGGGADIDPLEQ